MYDVFYAFGFLLGFALIFGGCFALGWYSKVTPSNKRTAVTGFIAWGLGTLLIGIPLWITGRWFYNHRHPMPPM